MVNGQITKEEMEIMTATKLENHRSYEKMQKRWPTPSATPRGAHTGTEAGEVSADGKSRTSAKGVKFGATLQTAVGSGQLNPTWVEWLMGFPIGYTDLED
tara:strand:+ start:597 stop:896 length:300 start_codon:yes stop_codon:yes gene_type:complete